MVLLGKKIDVSIKAEKAMTRGRKGIKRCRSGKELVLEKVEASLTPGGAGEG
jgi:hypothetical protein